MKWGSIPMKIIGAKRWKQQLTNITLKRCYCCCCDVGMFLWFWPWPIKLDYLCLCTLCTFRIKFTYAVMYFDMVSGCFLCCWCNSKSNKNQGSWSRFLYNSQNFNKISSILPFSLSLSLTISPLTSRFDYFSNNKMMKNLSQFLCMKWNSLYKKKNLFFLLYKCYK